MTKVIVSALALVLLSSCGIQRQLNELKNRQAQSEVDSLARDEALQLQINGLAFKLRQLRSQLISMDMAFAQSASTLSQQSNEVQGAVLMLQAQQNSALSQLATLQGYTSIIEVVNPCGNQTAADEVFLKLSSGKYLASFSDSASGSNTRFSQLYDGEFTTTDASGCRFTVSNNGTVISNEHN